MNITIAYSPDTDDAFMVHALAHDYVAKRGYKIAFYRNDIQSLNRQAVNTTYDITAISVAAYPFLTERYYLLPVGASVGDKVGPAVVTRIDQKMRVEDLRDKRIAVPGLQTSAYFAAYSLLGPFEPVAMDFRNIERAVKAGEVDAGVLIHELQLNCQQSGLRRVADLGQAWWQVHKLPLPLGANVIRRDLNESDIQTLCEIYADSISYGLSHRQETLTAALTESKTDLCRDDADSYISRYVNHRSMGLQPDVVMAMQKLFDVGHQYQLCPKTEVAPNVKPQSWRATYPKGNTHPRRARDLDNQQGHVTAIEESPCL